MTLTIATIDLAPTTESAAPRIGICPLPGRGGKFESDLADVLRWKPDAVVSMTERAEMERGGAADLGARLADAGVLWRHLPIRDYGGPAGDVADAWPALAKELHAILDRGGAVLTHCYGGHGRSGMVAMRLLVERGEDPEAALKRTRAVRPGAVEAPGQFAWASAGRRSGASGGW